jgi:hypothetical protein
VPTTQARYNHAVKKYNLDGPIFAAHENESVGTIELKDNYFDVSVRLNSRNLFYTKNIKELTFI